MSTPRLAALVAGLALVLAGCVPAPAGPASPSPTASPSGPDLTAPGAAEAMIETLIARAGTTRLLEVEVTRQTARISVIKAGQSESWAWRDGVAAQVDSDVIYVGQAVFAISEFDISDVGALFRRAASAAGADTGQELRIVDSSAGEVMMTVTTVPESRTVFFYPDGRLLPVLSFHSPGGIETGLADAIGGRRTAISVGVASSLGAYVDFAGSERTIVRRLRAAAVPTTILERAETPALPPFELAEVSAAAIWTVLQRARSDGRYTDTTAWSVVIDDRDRLGEPAMHFSIGGRVVVTDLAGRPVPER